MRLNVVFSACLLAGVAACQSAPTVSQDLSFVCTVTTAAGPVTQAVLAGVDPVAAAGIGGVEVIAAQVCAKIGGLPAPAAMQAKPATRV